MENGTQLRNMLWEMIYKQFKKEFEEWNSLYTHPVIKGGENEKALKTFLNFFLPKKFQLEQNVILIDKNGNQSTEQDIVIWNPYEQPRILKNKFFLIESILGCIEVKTILNKKMLEDFIVKIQNLRKMDHFKRVDGDLRWQVHPPLCFIFAYDCIWEKFGFFIKHISSIVEKHNIKPSERFDFLYIMKKGIIVNWDIPVEEEGIGDFEKQYGGKAFYNERWPQFFPSKLINDLPLTLHEWQITQQENRKEGYYASLTTENQILGLIDFTRSLCQALEDQKIFQSFLNISTSYDKCYRGKSGLSSADPY